MLAQIQAAFLAAIALLHRSLKKRPDDAQGDGDRGGGKETSAHHSEEPAADMLHTEWAAIQAAIREIHTSEKRHQTSERHILAAQIRAANRLNWITGIGAFISVLGLIFVGLSLLIAKRAADDARIVAYAAKDQASAAQIQSRVAIDEQRRSHRPWIDLRGIEIDEPLNFTSETATLSIKAIVKNIGNSQLSIPQ
jgi:hypothetical protein